jgi:integrase
MNIDVTTAIILDKRRQRKDGTYPVKLRVIYRRKPKYYPCMNLSAEMFERSQKENPRGEARYIAADLKAFEVEARKIIDSLEPFSFAEFERRFLNDRPEEGNKLDVYAALQRYIDRLTKEGKAGTAQSYRGTLKSLQKYRPRLEFPEVTPELLKDYEKWILAQGKSITTVGIYLRQLRAVFNEAIEAGIIAKERYPFGRRKYQIPAGRNVKKALTKAEIAKLFNYVPATKSEAKYFALWKFSYLCNGMNPKDIIHLRHKDIKGDKLYFYREKTKNTNRGNMRAIEVVLHPMAAEIIKEYGTAPEPEAFVFPYLWDKIPPEEELVRRRYFVRNINRHIRRIAERLGIEKDVTTYTARHSFATILKRSGAPKEYISESLGHADLKTTEAYLDSFEDDMKRKYADMLTNFDEGE